MSTSSTTADANLGELLGLVDAARRDALAKIMFVVERDIEALIPDTERRKLRAAIVRELHDLAQTSSQIIAGQMITNQLWVDRLEGVLGERSGHGPQP